MYLKTLKQQLYAVAFTCPEMIIYSICTITYTYACIGDQNAHVKSKIKIIYNFLSSTSLIINTYIIYLQMNNF